MAGELSAFCLHYQEHRDRLWLAMDGQRIQRSVAIDGSHLAESAAH